MILEGDDICDQCSAALTSTPRLQAKLQAKLHQWQALSLRHYYSPTTSKKMLLVAIRTMQGSKSLPLLVIQLG